MNIHSFVSFILLVVFLVNDISCIDSKLFNSHSNDECKITNELYWKMIQWFYGPLTFVHVNVLTETEPTSSMNHFAGSFIKEITNRFNVKVTFKLLNTHFENAKVTFYEMFSWQGEEFERRPGQASVSVYRKKRSLDSESQNSWPKRTDKPEARVFVIAENIRTIDEYLVGSARFPFRHPRQLYVIAITMVTEPDFDALCKRVLEKLWNNYGIANALIITPCNDDPEIVRVFFPFTRINASFWSEHKSLNLNDIDFKKSDLFNKFNDLQGFPLRITLFWRYPTALSAKELPKVFHNSYLMKDIWRSDGYGGVDGIMLAHAAKSINFTAVNIPQVGIDFGYKASNGSFVGSIGSVLRSKVYASFNGRFMTNYDTNDIDYMFPYYFDKLCIISPKALKIPEWMAIFKCFSEAVWLSLLVVNCSCGLFWFLLKRSNIEYLSPNKKIKQCEKQKSNNHFRNVFIEMWIIMMSGPTPHLPSLSKERIFMATCLFSSIIFAGSFQGSLTTSFSTVTYYKDINTLKELDESGLEIGTSSGSLKNLFGTQNVGTPLTGLISSLASKYKLINTTTPIITRAAYKRDICCIERLTDIAVIIANQYENPDGSVLLHVIKQCPRSYYMSYIMKRGSPLLPTFSNFIHRLFEGGIVNLWYDHVEYVLITHQRYRRISTKSKEAQAFTMIDMQTAFYILCIGLCTSCFVLICEIYVHKRKQNQPYKPFVH